ncbi:hypothetical protein C8F01DRAFT_1156457, partial [Mycena amicta]
RKLKDAYGPRPRRFIDGLRTLHTALAALRHRDLVSHIDLSLPSWYRIPDGVNQRALRVARLFSRSLRNAWVPRRQRHTDPKGARTRTKLSGNDGVRGWHVSLAINRAVEDAGACGGGGGVLEARSRRESTTRMSMEDRLATNMSRTIQRTFPAVASKVVMGIPVANSKQSEVPQ